MERWRVVPGWVLAFCFFAGSSFAQAGSEAARGENPREPMTVEILAIDLEKVDGEEAGAPPRLFLEIENRSPWPLVGWMPEVRVDGVVVDGYEDLLILGAVEPGDTIRLELHRLAGVEAPFRLAVTLLEVWRAEKAAAPHAGERVGEQAGDPNAWRLLEPLKGSAVEAERVVEAGSI